MQLPERYREGWIKFAVSETERSAFAEASKGHLYFQVPHLQPGAIDACVWRVAVLPESGPLAPRELEPAAVRGKRSTGPKFGRGDVR